MKKALLFLFFSFCVSLLYAQGDTVRLREISKKHMIVTDRPPQAFYFGLGGAGPIMSVNYDTRFTNRVSGLGCAAGLGYFGVEDFSIFSVPVSLNYLFGRRTHFVELAAGATYFTGSNDLFDDTETSGFFGHINIGYRLQPTNGGFFLRAGYSPLFSFSGGGNVPSMYVGFGYNF